jgi:hypothetical protein
VSDESNVDGFDLLMLRELGHSLSTRNELISTLGLRLIDTESSDSFSGGPAIGTAALGRGQDGWIFTAW